MKKQDIKELKEFCDKKGWYFDFDEVDGTALIVRDKDPFDGVEFVQSNWSKNIYPVTQIGNFKPCNEEYTPSTEAAYVEQLKAKAHELYGDIKNGDRFWIDENLGEVSMYDCEDGFSYWKEEDLLYFVNYAIYSKGKWAKKIERVRVVPSEIHYPKPDNLDQYVTVELRIIGGMLDSTKSKGAIEELAKCLEDYLNNS